MERSFQGKALVILLLLTVTFFNIPDQSAQTVHVQSSWATRWTACTPTPKQGGYGEAVAWDGTYVYIVRCRIVTEMVYFWRYNPEADMWLSLSTPYVDGENTGIFRTGTALAWDGAGYIYALAGARYTDSDRRLFLRYSISSDQWEIMSNTPAPQGAGDALCWSNYDKKFYALLGSREHGTSFACYDPSSDIWTLKSDPVGGTEDGASLVSCEGRYIYALRGEYYETVPCSDFWRYDIETDSWTTIEPVPDLGGVGDGGSLLWVGNFMLDEADYIYALGGGSCYEDPGFGSYRYSISNKLWEVLEHIPYPVGYYVGNRLGFAGDSIYCWQGTPSTWEGGGNRFCAYPLVEFEFLSSTELTLLPSTFEISPGDSVILKATLTSDGTPLDGKPITFIALAGTVNPLIGKTDSNGQVEVAYTAPPLETSTTITAAFAGDINYRGSTASSSGTVVKAPTTLSIDPSTFTVLSEASVTLTATLTSNGQPLPGKLIEFLAIPGTVSPNVGTTDLEGMVRATYTAPVVNVPIPVKITATFLGDLKYKASSVTSSGTIEAVPLLPTITIQGAAFCMPESITNYVSQYTAEIPEEVQKILPLPIPSTAFILATKQNLSLVLADQSDKGIASVEGWILPGDIKLNGISLSVILARNLSFNKEGKPTTVGEILANPKNYELELVKLVAFRKQVSILYDPDDGSEVEVPVTTGYVTEEREKVIELMRESIRKGGELIKSPNGSFVKDLLRTEQTRLPVFNFEYEYWIDCQAETNGIVLTPYARILDMLQRIVPIGELIQLEELPILYDVKTSLVYENVSSVREINENPEEYIGKVIGLSSNGFGGAISVQEAIKIVATIPVDVLLEGMEAWDVLSVPPETEELLIMVGASNIHQDEVFSEVDGQFKYVGRIISAREIDESLPAERLALVIYQRQKIGEIDYEMLAEAVKEEVRDRVQEVYFVLTNFMEEQPPSVIPIKPPIRVVNPIRLIIVETPEDLPMIVMIARKAQFTVGTVTPETPVSLELENSSISKIEMKLAEIQWHVNITIEKLEEKPTDLPEPSALAWAYHEISVNIPDYVIESARVNFWVLKEWLRTHGAVQENVTLLRYYAIGWDSLVTEVTGENLTHVHYVATSPGFSTFAITAPFPPLQVTAQLSPETATQGETVTISAMVKDLVENPIEGATVAATIGDLEDLIVLSDQGDGSYQGIIDTSGWMEGTYPVVVTAQKEGYESAQTGMTLTVKAAVPWTLYGGIVTIIVIATVVAVFYKIKQKRLS